MKARLDSVRIAPKKANLIAKLVRGLTVPEAMDQLSRTNKKAARMIEQLLRSAIANASHNDKQDAQMMVIKTIVVNQGQAYHRGMPMARGRQRPYRKFLSHIDLVLGFPESDDVVDAKPVAKSAAKDASQDAKTEVKKRSSPKKKKDSEISSSSAS